MENTGERRLSRRYMVRLAVQFRVSYGRTVNRWCAGTICDISTTGVVFRTAKSVPANAPIELIIDWPAKRDDLYPITLRATGIVVRCEGRKIAVRMTYCRMVSETPASPGTAASAYDTLASS